MSPFVFFFSLALAPFLGELRWPVDLLSLFLCLSLSLYPKFVDMTINLSLILQTIRIQKHFPLSVFVFIDSLVVFASQDAGGHTLSRQNNLTCSVCTDGRSGVRYVITKFSCFHRLPIYLSNGASPRTRAPLLLVIKIQLYKVNYVCGQVSTVLITLHKIG